jgi:hypothetical protein
VFFQLASEAFGVLFAFNVFDSEDGTPMARYIGGESLDQSADSTEGLKVAWPGGDRGSQVPRRCSFFDGIF